MARLFQLLLCLTVLPCPASRGAGVDRGGGRTAPLPGATADPGEGSAAGGGRDGTGPEEPPYPTLRGPAPGGRHPCEAPGSLRCLLRLFKYLRALMGSSGCQPPGAGLVAGSAHCLPSDQACRVLGSKPGGCAGWSARLPFLGTLLQPSKATDTEI